MKKLTLFLVALAMLLVACKPEIEKPTVVTKSVGEITQTTAKIVGQVTEDGGAEVTERGVCWSTEGNPTILDFRTVDGTGVGSYTSSLSDLAPQTTYYVRAYATNEAGTAYGEEKSFTTLEVIPEEPGDEPEEPGDEPEEPGDEPEEPGDEPEEPGDEPEEPGDEPEEPGDEPEEPGDEPEEPGDEPEEPGDDEEEEEVCDCNIEFRIEEITDIGINSADAIVNLSSGAYNAEYIGVCWNTSGNPYPGKYNVDKYWITVYHGEGIYEISMDFLEENTTYYVRPYVDCYNHDEYILGEEVIIKTMEPKLPTVTTAEVVEMINCTSVECSAEVTSVGYLGQHVTRRGFCWSTTSTPTVNDNEIHEEGYYTANYTMRLENLLPQTTYYVRAYATNEVGTAYGEERIFTTLPIEETLNGYTWVDLGLPSGTKWATCNVGATTPEEYGDYFAWGETSTKETYDEDNCPTYGLYMPTLETQGYIDSEDKLTPQYDAATANWGGSWRMPTSSELNELHTNCTWTWTAQNGVNGYKVTGPSGASIFLPAAGARFESSLHNAGSYGSYWSSTPKDHYGWHTEDCASALIFDSGWQLVDNDDRNRSYGRSVRPVLD